MRIQIGDGLGAPRDIVILHVPRHGYWVVEVYWGSTGATGAEVISGPHADRSAASRAVADLRQIDATFPDADGFLGDDK